jgi:hypothetical protein
MADALASVSDAHPDPEVACTQTPTTEAPDEQVTSPDTAVASAGVEGGLDAEAEADADADAEARAAGEATCTGEGVAPGR